MALLRVSISDEQDELLEAQVEAGTYRSKSEAFHAILDSNERTTDDEPSLLTAYRNAGLLRL